jgi:hypothetical protein
MKRATRMKYLAQPSRMMKTHEANENIPRDNFLIKEIFSGLNQLYFILARFVLSVSKIIFSGQDFSSGTQLTQRLRTYFYIVASNYCHWMGQTLILSSKSITTS